MYQGKREPPCGKCFPRIMPANEEAYRVWTIAQGQVVTAGMGEVIDISIPAVEIVMRRMKVRDPDRCLFKVLELARMIAEEQANKREHGTQ